MAFHARRDHWLAVGEPLPVLHPDVGGENDGVGRRYGRRRQWGAARGPLSFHAERHLGPLGRELEGVGRHVGVSDPGGARGDSDERFVLWCSRVWIQLGLAPAPVSMPGGCLRMDDSLDQCDDVVGRVRGEATNSGRTNARARHDRSFIVALRPHRARRSEHQIGGAVGAPKSTPATIAQSRQWCHDGRRTAMRNCDPTGKTCRRLLFSEP